MTTWTHSSDRDLIDERLAWQAVLRSLAVLAGASPAQAAEIAEGTVSLWTECPRSLREYDELISHLTAEATGAWERRVVGLEDEFPSLTAAGRSELLTRFGRTTCEHRASDPEGGVCPRCWEAVR